MPGPVAHLALGALLEVLPRLTFSRADWRRPGASATFPFALAATTIAAGLSAFAVSAGAGLIKVTMTGRHDVRRIHIDPSLMEDDKEMLEDLIAAAMNDANRKVEEMTQSKMSAVGGGLGLPPGMKLPF